MSHIIRINLHPVKSTSRDIWPRKEDVSDLGAPKGILDRFLHSVKVLVDEMKRSGHNSMKKFDTYLGGIEDNRYGHLQNENP